MSMLTQPSIQTFRGMPGNRFPDFKSVIGCIDKGMAKKSGSQLYHNDRGGCKASVKPGV